MIKIPVIIDRSAEWIYTIYTKQITAKIRLD